MFKPRWPMRTPTIVASIVLTTLFSSLAIAHCDSMSGPVVKDAQAALASKKIDSVLKWVGRGDEATIRDAFEMALAVRGESDVAKAVADKYFFETLVRIHRATEGEGFTGLKPAGSVDPAIASSDLALERGSIDEVAAATGAAVRDGVKQRFADAYAKRQVAGKTVEQGREYVKAYVELTHYVVAVEHLVSSGPSHKHLEGVTKDAQ